MPVSDDMRILQDAITECKPAFSFNDFDFTNDEFAGFMTKPIWELHTGITIRIIKMLRGIRIGNYIGKFKAEEVIAATFDIEELLQSIIKPIKDEVIEEFYANATIVQTNEINRVLNNVNKQMKSNTIQMQL